MTRPTAPGLDAILGQPFPVLDHGFIRVVDYMGNDEAIEQSARVSYGEGTRATSETRGLLRYLMRHRHTTPFEMCEIKVHVRLPIFVARQWIRHRTGSFNEYSARYSEMKDEFYIPRAEDLATQSTANKQGRGEPLSAGDAARVLEILQEDSHRSHLGYQKMMGTYGLSRELARLNLTLNTYTEWYWKTDLHNLFHFLGLRADPHAQKEIRQYANLMHDFAEIWCPLATEAWREYRLNAVTLSASAVAVIKRRIAGETVTRDGSGMDAREWREFVGEFGG
tara:strand:+ start:3488 stop:4327 length:840 start_codon:yes stop_codon:yes gene_type:complete